MGDVARWRGFDSIVARWGSGFVATLCASFCSFTRASEMFAETRSRIHESYCLRRADVALFRGDSQVAEALWSTADRVEVRFRGSKGDRTRNGGVLT